MTSRSTTRRGVGRRRHTGFTLIELLLVLVILAVLAAVVVPKFTGRSEQARVAAAGTDISSIETALETFEVDAGRFPTSDEGLAALVRAPSNVRAWNGPYIKSKGGLPKDPWGNPYLYRFPGQNNPGSYDLHSMGPDGADGGDDDITNW